MMDNYIYYRILSTVIDKGTISRTELIDLTSLHTYSLNPIDDLEKLGYLKTVTCQIKRKQRCYQVTEKGLDVHYKMHIFFTKYDKMFKQLHVKLKLGVNKKYDEIVLVSS